MLKFVYNNHKSIKHRYLNTKPFEKQKTLMRLSVKVQKKTMREFFR